MKTKKRIFLFAFGVLFFVGAHTVNAQVTIGGETTPVKGATLDLSPTGGYVGGFKLPNVSLDADLTTIPVAFTDKTSVTQSELIGTMVYNTNSNIGEGVYLWDGTKWQTMFSSGAGSLLNSIYPIGSIYMSIDPTDPTDIFGGTWEVWGSGLVPVGVKTSDTDFATVEQSGGKKTHILTVNEMPSHTHIQDSHYHTSGAPQNPTSGGNWYGWTLNAPALYASGTGQVTTGRATATNQNTGGSDAHNNLQPYITCYMWKRIG